MRNSKINYSLKAHSRINWFDCFRFFLIYQNQLYIWFGAEPLVASAELIKKLPLGNKDDIRMLTIQGKDCRILDVGSGNGHFCELLLSEGFSK